MSRPPWKTLNCLRNYRPDAEAVEWQLADEITVNETGFRRTEGETFDTFEIAAIGLGYAIALELSEAGAA